MASATNSLSDIADSFSILIATSVLPLYLPWTTFCTDAQSDMQDLITTTASFKLRYKLPLPWGYYHQQHHHFTWSDSVGKGIMFLFYLFVRSSGHMISYIPVSSLFFVSVPCARLSCPSHQLWAHVNLLYRIVWRAWAILMKLTGNNP